MGESIIEMPLCADCGQPIYRDLVDLQWRHIPEFRDRACSTARFDRNVSE